MPLPCYARVTNLRNGRSMLVRVNDRGPFVGDRLIDVSARVANLLDFQRSGLTKVKVEYVGMAPLSGADGPALLASLSTRESSSDGVSAYAPTAAGVSAYAPAAAARNIFPAANALAATNRAATLPLRTASLDVDGPARMVSFDAPPLRDVSPPSPYGELAPSPYGDLAPWPADPAAPSSLMAEIRQ
jgi:rare lipoprotein A